MTTNSTPYVVATMDTLGFIKDDPQLAMDRHFTYFFAARRNLMKLIPAADSYEYTRMQNDDSENCARKTYGA